MKKALVTGGGGFVGKAIVEQLLDRSVSCVVLGRNRYPNLEEKGVVCIQGDIREKKSVTSAMQGVDTVFHVAALAGIWGSWDDYYSINVAGSQNVLSACRETGVKRLIYTSTPSVVFDGNDIEGDNESLPYPGRFLCHYAKSKMMAEKIVLQANNNNLLTCAIRPHLVWGPGDPHLIPRLLERGRSGSLKIVGSGTNMVDISYIDNVAHAHLLAADNLEETGSCSGKPYFISQGEPVNLWDWINELFNVLKIKSVNRSVSLSAAYRIGAFLEFVYTVLQRKSEPPMTRFLAEQLGRSHYFSIQAAQNDLQYSPLVSTRDGMKRLVNWIQTL